MRWISEPADLADADVIVIPGSKATVADLGWLRARGLADVIAAHAGSGRAVKLPGSRAAPTAARSATGQRWARRSRSVVISARIDSELAVLDPAEQAEFLESLGLAEPGLNRLIREAYALLGLQSYFTVGPKEARAWTIPIGATAPQAAGVIHTDFEKGFIRAETISFEDFVTLKGEAKAREAGKLRAEGKSYVVKDGDVMNFLFN